MPDPCFDQMELDFTSLAEQPRIEVEVVRSARRRKTVQASVVDGRIRVLLPARMSAAEERHWVEVMRQRLERQLRPPVIDLTARASALAARYDLPAARLDPVGRQPAAALGLMHPAGRHHPHLVAARAVPWLGGGRGDRARARAPRGGEPLPGVPRAGRPLPEAGAGHRVPHREGLGRSGPRGARLIRSADRVDRTGGVVRAHPGQRIGRQRLGWDGSAADVAAPVGTAVDPSEGVFDRPQVGIRRVERRRGARFGRGLRFHRVRG